MRPGTTCSSRRISWTPFREAVAAAVAGADGDTAAVERWSGWSVEVFADLASVAMLGPWALWPIAELELRASSAMAAPRGAYPPGALRLRLLECAIREAGLDPAPAWPVGSGPPAVDDLPDAGFVDDVVKAGLRVGPPGFTLLDWIGLRTDEFGPVGECEQWRAWFGDGPQPDTHASLRAPRLVIAGALAATADARGAPPAERAALLKAVRERAFAQMIALRDPERRAADDATDDVPADVGFDLADLLAHGDLPEPGDPE